MKRHILVLAAVAYLAWSPASHAALSIRFGNTPVIQGQEAIIPVMISGSGDMLQSFGFEFRITTAGQTRLEFASTQPVDYLSHSSYVFFDHSTALYYAPPVFVGNVGQSPGGVPNDTYSGGDSAVLGDGSLTDVALSGEKLFTQLKVTTLTGAAPESGDSFTIALVPVSSDSNTSFYSDAAGNFSIPAAHTDIVIAPVPEPSTWAAMLTGAGGLCVLGWTMLRRQGRTPGRGAHDDQSEPFFTDENA